MCQKEKILIIEDEEAIQQILSFQMECEGYHYSQARTGEAALQLAEEESPDLILLDLMLPLLDGFEVCRCLKKNPKTANIPIIMLTAKGSEMDIVTGLELGADDYIVKPFSNKVLLARIRTALRRKRLMLEASKPPKTTTLLREGALSLNLESRAVEVDGIRVDLLKSEFELLSLLMRWPDRVFSRSQIIEYTKGDALVTTERAVDVQIAGLRKKLGEAGKLIRTVRGVGYKFGPE